MARQRFCSIVGANGAFQKCNLCCERENDNTGSCALAARFVGIARIV